MIATAVEGQGALARAIAAALAEGTPGADVSGDHLVLVAGGSVTAIIERVRQAVAGVVIVIIDAGWTPIDRHLLLASIEPLAVARAPATRVCAVQLAADADLADAVAAVEYLLSAQSVTGQILTIEPRPAAG